MTRKVTPLLAAVRQESDALHFALLYSPWPCIRSGQKVISSLSNRWTHTYSFNKNVDAVSLKKKFFFVKDEIATDLVSSYFIGSSSYFKCIVLLYCDTYVR